MPPRLWISLVCLRVGAALCMVLGGGLAYAWYAGTVPIAGLLAGIGVLGLALFTLLTAAGLHSLRRWAWTSAVLLCGVFTLVPPVGLAGLVGLLDSRTREWFLHSDEHQGVPAKPVNRRRKD